MNEFKSILENIKNKILKPIYFLMGEEPYYIDKISNYIEKNVLNESEKEFNQLVVYGRDITVDEIVSFAKRFPMMAEKQVIIVKEAQDLFRTIEKLVDYLENPQTKTILVLNFKYKKLDKRKKIYKAISKNGIIFESKKLYDNQIYDWIQAFLNVKKYTIEHKAIQMLVEFLGNDLNKISNELEKLILILPKKTNINPNHIEENIGVSKDYNNFELRKAIGQRNVIKANKIINYFIKNSKKNPIVMTISLLNNFFFQLLLYHGLKDKSKASVAKSLGINQFYVNEYVESSRNYPMRKISKIISFLRDADLKSKGINANQSYSDILKELIFKIIH